MTTFRRTRILAPLVSALTMFALSVQAEEPAPARENTRKNHTITVHRLVTCHDRLSDKGGSRDHRHPQRRDRHGR